MSDERDSHEAEREGRRVGFGVVFEAEFGQRTALRALERRLEDEGSEPAAARHARAIVEAVVEHRDTIDAAISRVAPQYPVTQLARIDRALLRCALGELLHCPTTPTRVAIAEWVELARTYSGEPARRLLNGVLGRVAGEAVGRGRDLSASDNGNEGGGGDRHTGGSTS
jgi:transcription antitermination protein NusB